MEYSKTELQDHLAVVYAEIDAEHEAVAALDVVTDAVQIKSRAKRVAVLAFEIEATKSELARFEEMSEADLDLAEISGIVQTSNEDTDMFGLSLDANSANEVIESQARSDLDQAMCMALSLQLEPADALVRVRTMFSDLFERAMDEGDLAHAAMFLDRVKAADEAIGEW